MWPSGIRTHDLLVPRGALYRCATTAAQDKKCNYFFKILAETCFKPEVNSPTAEEVRE